VKPHSSRRAFCLAGAALAWLPAAPAMAQGYPAKMPIKIVVPFEPGGTLDVAVRPLAASLGTLMGQSVIVENRAGANGVIGTEYVARSAPDGYTLLAVTASFALNPSMYKELHYNVIKDFAPITGLMQGAGFVVIINPSVPAKTLQELIALEKKSGHMAFSSPGVGNTIHIASELFNQHAGTHFLHVPYKGSAPSLNAVVSGEVQLAIMPPGIVMPFIRAGKLRALAFTGDKRLPDLPDVPTMAEAGVPDFVFQGTWMGLFAPAGTPKTVIDKLHAEVHEALQQPALHQTLINVAAGYIPDGSPPDQFAKQVQDDVKRYGDILRTFHIKPE
jgi:tripartite-type tricarboxylate transporter receptor subunit TctC